MSTLLSLEAALERMLDRVTPVATTMVGVDEALGRVLAEPVIAHLTLPPWDNSAMDGFALQSADVTGATKRWPKTLRVVGESRAGHVPDAEVRSGTAIRILTYYGITDVDVVAAALLHDSVEDHSLELSGDRSGDPTAAALAVLAERFGARVAELVAAVTNPPAEPGRNRHEQYREHLAESLAANPWARVIKLSDFTDNGVGLIHSTPERLRPLACKPARCEKQ